MTVKNTYFEVHGDLIEKCRKNDRKAQIRIYELYYKAMFNTSYRIVSSTTEAEDIMQEAFLDAFRKIDSYKGSGSFGSWLKRIVINKSLDHIKSTKETTSLDENDLDIEDSTELDDSYAENVFVQMEEINQALDKLPNHYRIILSLYLLEGYDQQEIAQILDLSHNNVRTRYLRAKKRLLAEVKQSKDHYLNTINN